MTGNYRFYFLCLLLLTFDFNVNVLEADEFPVAHFYCERGSCKEIEFFFLFFLLFP